MSEVKDLQHCSVFLGKRMIDWLFVLGVTLTLPFSCRGLKVCLFRWAQGFEKFCHQVPRKKKFSCLPYFIMQSTAVFCHLVTLKPSHRIRLIHLLYADGWMPAVYIPPLVSGRKLPCPKQSRLWASAHAVPLPSKDVWESTIRHICTISTWSYVTYLEKNTRDVLIYFLLTDTDSSAQTCVAADSEYWSDTSTHTHTHTHTHIQTGNQQMCSILSYLLSEVPPLSCRVLQRSILGSGHTSESGPPLPQWRHGVAGDDFAGLRDDLL